MPPAPPDCSTASRRSRVTDQFWAEGAAIADFNHDGKMDVVAGPFWYEGPDFKKRHEDYPANASFKRKTADGMERTIPGYEGALGVNNAYSDCFLTFTYDFNGDGWMDVVVPELVYSREGDRYARDVCRGSRWASVQPRALPLGHPVRGVVEFGNGGPDAYVGRVEHALAEIQSGRLQKVVLARAVHVTARSAIDPVAWLVALRERFPACTLFAVGEGDAVFLGASPERLIRVDGERVETAALAGTAPRGGSQAADRALGEALCECRKNGAEHAAVVDYLKSVLADCCDDVEVAAEPTLLRTRTVQHLCTELSARRRPGSPVSLLELVSRMHPTPAVGGAPRDAALRWLAAHEGIDRGWFAGPVGYLQSQGDGEFAVALRSALVRGRSATAWAGAGIVAGSEPRAEFTETELKLRTVLGPLLWGAP